MGNISDEVKKNGFCFLPRFRPDLSLDEAIKVLGRRESTNRESAEVLRPFQKSEISDSSYSAKYGLNSFPLHTDYAHHRIPPRYLFLRCELGSSTVTTCLVDGANLKMLFGISNLSRMIFRPRKPLNGGRPLYPVFEPAILPDGILRWDEVFLQPVSRLASDLFADVLHTINSSEVIKLYLEDRGDSLLIDNWRMLHGRGRVDPQSMSRKVLRCYLEEIE